MLIHLNCHSFYSFNAGTIPVTELPHLAKELGMPAVALTDTNNLSGALEFYLACRETGVKPIIGVELSIGAERAILLAKNWEGYREISEAVTALLEKVPQSRPKLDLEALIGEKAGKQVVEELPESKESLLPFVQGLSKNVILLSSSPSLLESLATTRPFNTFIELIPAEQYKWKRLRGIFTNYKLPFVATNRVFLKNPEDYEIHTVLRAIGTNTTIGTTPKYELSHAAQYFVNEGTFKKLLGRVSNEAVENTVRIAEQCNIEFDLQFNKFARFPVRNPPQHLRELSLAGFNRRYPNPSAQHYTRFEYELDLIDQLSASSYYLAVHDMVQYARKRNFPYLGRGSGANSLIAYCLDISNVDPILNNLRFERFLNPERQSAPDFDMDFSWRDRYEVIHYLLKKYGKENAAMLCTIQCYRNRGSLREVGKALGLPDSEINEQIELVNNLRFTESLESKQQVRDIIKKGSKYGDVQTLFRYADKIHGYPRNLSVHAGGLVIADRKLSYYTPVQMAPIGVPITQQDMFSAEDWKLIKLDVLATRGLGTYWDTMAMVEDRYGVRPPVEDETVAFKDESTKELIRSGNTKGCFYIESPAMISLLKKLGTDTFENLTAASSVIRPGVAQSGMMQEFIKRHRDPSIATHIHPLMGELMKETYGIMVYQEDVLTVVHEFAGLSYGEADLFRRAMSGKLRSHERMAQMKGRFVEGCQKRGITVEVAEEVWRQVSSFAGYSFCKAHSASYAVLSFKEAWLKMHYPAEFMCGVLNNFGGYYNHQEYITEAKALGLKVLLPNVNKSEYLHTVHDSRTIQLGFVAFKDLSSDAVAKILTARKTGGEFKSIFDFAKRTRITPFDGQLVVSLGACLDFEPVRPHGVFKIGCFLGGKRNRGRKKKGNPNQWEFDLTEEDFPDLSHISEYDSLYIYNLEKTFLGYSVSKSPFDFLREYDIDCVRSIELPNYLGKTVTVLGYVSTSKRTSTRRGDAMLMLNLTDEKGMMDIVVWPEQFKRFYTILVTSDALKITGKVSESFGVITLEAKSIERLEFKSDQYRINPAGKLVSSQKEEWRNAEL